MTMQAYSADPFLPESTEESGMIALQSKPGASIFPSPARQREARRADLENEVGNLTRLVEAYERKFTQNSDLMDEEADVADKFVTNELLIKLQDARNAAATARDVAQAKLDTVAVAIEQAHSPKLKPVTINSDETKADIAKRLAERDTAEKAEAPPVLSDGRPFFLEAEFNSV